MKPQLSLEDRKKSLEDLKAKTKCNDCGETGHWRGDPGCKKKKTGFLAVASASSSGHDGVAWHAVMNGPLEADSDEECDCAYMNVGDDGFEHVQPTGAQS